MELQITKGNSLDHIKSKNEQTSQSPTYSPEEMKTLNSKYRLNAAKLIEEFEVDDSPRIKKSFF